MRKILAIDGGGIFGIVPAVLLQKLEEMTKKPISHHFDMISGTSTGGIVALCLNKPNSKGKPAMTAEDTTNMYIERGEEIFTRSFWYKITSGNGWKNSKYGSKYIDKVLKETFGDFKLSECIKPTMVTSYNIESRSPFFFKSWYAPDRYDYNAYAVARATSAAPTYFSTAIAKNLIDGSEQHLIDGGIFANNPSMCAYAEAKRLWPTEAILVVSMGTGSLNTPISSGTVKNAGLIKWAPHIFSAMMDGVQDAVDYQLDKSLLKKNYYRFQKELFGLNDAMDDASKKNVKAIRDFAEQMAEDFKPNLESLAGALNK